MTEQDNTQTAKRKKYTMDLCTGPLVKKLVLFTLPLMGSLLLQMTFNTADLIVIGRYASARALAAVGATTSVSGLLMMFIYGLSVGNNVLTSNAFGARNFPLLRRTTYTALTLAAIVGVIIGALGIWLAPYLLRLQRTPADVLPLATTYMRIIFMGMFFNSVYNFGSATLNAMGDTRRPLFFLAGAGVVNVVLNLFFVLCLKMDVDGVGWATVISQAISSVLVVWAIAHTEEIGGLPMKQLRVRLDIFRQTMAIGVPSSFQSLSFCLANVVVQSCINSFGSMAVAGSTAALSIEYFLSMAGGAFQQTSQTFTAQNMGAKQYSRMKRGVLYSIAMSVGITMVMSVVFLIFGRYLIGIFNTTDVEVIDWGMERMWALFPYYFTAALMSCLAGMMRGAGHSTAMFLIILVCACVYRLLWICFIFPLHRTLTMLMIIFPISWTLISVVCIFFLHGKLKNLADENASDRT